MCLSVCCVEYYEQHCVTNCVTNFSMHGSFFFVLGGPDDGHDLKNSFNQHRILTDFIKGIWSESKHAGVTYEWLITARGRRFCIDRNARCVLPRFFDFLELRDVLVARGRRKTKSHTCDFKFNYLQIQKIGVSSLFFVASDDSKDHERPNKDSKRWRKGMRRILLRSLSLVFVGRVVVGPFTFRKCLCSSSFRSEFSILSCSIFFFPLLFSSLLTTTTTTAQQEEEEKKNVNSNR